MQIGGGRSAYFLRGASKLLPDSCRPLARRRKAKKLISRKKGKQSADGQSYWAAAMPFMIAVIAS
jgi:hypothetical protein